MRCYQTILVTDFVCEDLEIRSSVHQIDGVEDDVEEGLEGIDSCKSREQEM